MARTVLQAGAIPFRRTGFGVEVLLVSAGEGWGFPKGGIKKGSDAAATACAESLEEAGVVGRIQAPALGAFCFRKRGRRHEVQVFGLEVTHQLARWQEERRRRRVWVPIAEAGPLLRRPAFAGPVNQLRRRLLMEPLVRVRRAA